MPESALLVPLAEIAGIFVAFGALISVRSSGDADTQTLVYLRAVTWIGLWVVVAALVPGAVSRYGVEGHGLWLPCALIALVTFHVLWFVDRRAPEMSTLRHKSSRRLIFRYVALVGPLNALLNAALILILVGVWPNREAALYLTAVTTGMVMAGFTLLILVFTQ
jgi:hypothetical protein